jgi:type II secretion system protein N
MRVRRFVAVVAAVFFGLLLLLALTLLFVPGGDLVGVVQRAMARQGLTLAVGSVGKVLPVGIDARQVVVSSEQGEIIAFDRLVCRVRLLPLLLGRLQWSADAELGSGRLSLTGTAGKRPQVAITSSNLRLERVAILKTVLGGSVQGMFSVSGSLAGSWPGAKGALKLDAAAIEMHDASLGGMRLPDALYRTMRGAFAVDGGKVTLQSVALEGDGIYARLQGGFPVTAPITAAPLTMTLELMPKSEFLDRQKLVFLLLTKFMVSPGNFLIPVKGTLGAPSVF